MIHDAIRMRPVITLLSLVSLACSSRSSAVVPEGPEATLTNGSSRTKEDSSGRNGTDCHMHLAQEGLSALPRDGAAALAALDDVGLQRGCVLSPGYHSAPGCASLRCPAQQEWTRQQNDWVISQAKESSRLLPFCGVPMGVPWAHEEVERCALAGARGVKLHAVSQRIALASDEGTAALGKIATAAAAAKIPLLLHIDHMQATEVEALFAIAAEHADTTFIAAHGIAGSAALLVHAPSNIWIEVSGIVHAPRAAGAHFVGLWREMGMSRVVLGSDWPMLEPSDHLAWLDEYPLTDAERSFIVSGNAERLFAEIGGRPR